MDGGHDDLGPPTHPDELALDADIGGGGGIDGMEGGLDDAGDMMDIGGGFDGPEYDAPEFNPDMADLGQVCIRDRCICTCNGVFAVFAVRARARVCVLYLASPALPVDQ